MVDWKKGLLSTAIAIIFVFFILQGVYTFWDEPKWDEFCNEQFARPFPEKLITDESVCNEVFKANANI